MRITALLVLLGVAGCRTAPYDDPGPGPVDAGHGGLPGEWLADDEGPLGLRATGDGVAWMSSLKEIRAWRRSASAVTTIARDQRLHFGLRWPTIGASDGRLAWLNGDPTSQECAGGLLNFCRYTRAQVMAGGGGEQVRAITPAIVDAYVLASDGEAVYWVDEGALWRVARSGGPIEKLAAGPFGPSLVIAGDMIYVTASEGAYEERLLVEVPQRGGPSRVAHRADFRIHYLTSDGTSLFFMDSGVKRLTPATGELRTLGSVLSATPFVIDGSFSYWAADRTIVRLSLTTGASETLVTLPNHYVFEVAVDDGYLYWSVSRQRAVDQIYRQRLP